MDPRFNDNFHALRYMQEHGNELVLLTRQDPGLKSTAQAPEFERVSGVAIHRRWKNVAELNSLEPDSLARATKIADELAPDLIWCSYQGNLPLGRHLSERYRKPLIVLVESLYNRESLLGRRDRWWRSPLLELRARRYRQHLLERSDAIITSDPLEPERIRVLDPSGRRVFFVPWCTDVPEDMTASGSARARNKAVYIGSLYHFKNAQQLPGMIHSLLGSTPVEEVTVVGPGPLRPRIEALRARYGKALTYIESLPRADALAMLRESFFAFTATKMGGWGLFGDAWAVRTPLLALHNGYGLTDGVDASLATANGGVAGAARRLYDDAPYHEAIRDGGRKRYVQNHTAEAVGSAYLRVIRDVA
jgi:glycosyltransferase involved in cell wall biosynthesis